MTEGWEMSEEDWKRVKRLGGFVGLDITRIGTEEVKIHRRYHKPKVLPILAGITYLLGYSDGWDERGEDDNEDEGERFLENHEKPK